jgi:hypothetical protein
MADEVMEVWGRVKEWPGWMRQSLASRIVHSLETGRPPGPKTLADLVGLIANDQRPPTDEEVDQVLEEERLRKYG